MWLQGYGPNHLESGLGKGLLVKTLLKTRLELDLADFQTSAGSVIDQCSSVRNGSFTDFKLDLWTSHEETLF